MTPALLLLLAGIAIVLLGVAPFVREASRACHVVAAVLGVIVIVGAVLRF